MARTSRRMTNSIEATVASTQKNIVKEKEPLVRFHTAAYCRLSVENSGRKDEGTIETQIKMVKDYIEGNPELLLEDTYIDNGYTGTNFDRPEFLRMINDVKTGRIQCIVVKDLSRFGRDYLETGYYIDTIFPKLGVKLIAITDHFDSSIEKDRQGLAVAVKNLVNGLYAKDISRKIHASNEARRSRGEDIGNFPPYGYVRVMDDNGVKRYRIDDEYAPAVRMIFQWYLMGHTKPEIAKRLRLLGFPSPRKLQTERFNWKEQDVTEDHWKKSSLTRMLCNPVYIGNTVLQRSVRNMNEDAKTRRIPREEWRIAESTHEPIIPQEDFDRAIKIAGESSKQYECLHRGDDERKSDKGYFFTGKIFCGCCGKKMVARHSGHDGRSGSKVYVCKSYSIVCPVGGKFVNEDYLRLIVTDQIKALMKTLIDRKDAIKGSDSEKGDGTLASLNIRKGNIQFRLNENNERKGRLYEDFVIGTVTPEEYKHMKEYYIKSEQKLTDELLEINQSIRTYLKRIELLEQLAGEIGEATDSHEISRDFMRELVDRIEVFDDFSVHVTFCGSDMFEGVIGEEEMHEGSCDRTVPEAVVV